MPTKLLRLNNGIYVEAEVEKSEFTTVSTSNAKNIDKSFDQIIPILRSISSSIASAWKDMDQDVTVNQAEVQVNFSFEGEGNLYVTKAKASANLSVKLVFNPKNRECSEN